MTTTIRARAVDVDGKVELENYGRSAGEFRLVNREDGEIFLEAMQTRNLDKKRSSKNYIVVKMTVLDLVAIKTWINRQELPKLAFLGMNESPAKPEKVLALGESEPWVSGTVEGRVEDGVKSARDNERTREFSGVQSRQVEQFYLDEAENEEAIKREIRLGHMDELDDMHSDAMDEHSAYLHESDEYDGPTDAELDEQYDREKGFYRPDNTPD